MSKGTENYGDMDHQHGMGPKFGMGWRGALKGNVENEGGWILSSSFLNLFVSFHDEF